MSVLTKNGDVYADRFGYVVGRIASFFGALRQVIIDTRVLRRKMTNAHSQGEE